MFQPFSQEDNRITPELKGTGLGLSITKSLVDLMGGTIRVESESGKGTTIIIHLGFELAKESVKEQSEETESLLGADDKLAGKRILLVEDHPMNAKIAMRLLEKRNAIVYCAEDGKIALEKFESSQENFFDAILMDVRMPNMNGMESAKAIRHLKRDDAVTVPIIAMTANAYEDDVKECMDAGMNAHLAKPVEPQKMYAVINEFLTGKAKPHKKKYKPKLLIVDDQEANIAVLSANFESSYEIFAATSGQEALQILEKNSNIIAMITDIQMPEMTGLELIRSVRRNSKYNQMAILANTQYGEAGQEEELIRAGADDFVYKPTSPYVVATRLKNVLLKYR